MPIDEAKLLREKLKAKDKEISELKELLAEAEAEIKELNDFAGFQKPKYSILESRFLNGLIKGVAFIVIAGVLVSVGLYPWLFSDKIINDDIKSAAEEDLTPADEGDLAEEDTETNRDAAGGNIEDPEEKKDAKQERDIFSPTQKLIVASDLGWLNVRTEPNIETGKIIKKINSGEEYEWLEKTADNWYKIKIDSEGHTGYISGEYVEIK